MSAYMVDPIHIDLLVKVALRGPEGRTVSPGTAWHSPRWSKVTDAELAEMVWSEAAEQFHGVTFDGTGYMGADAMTPDQLGLMLITENLASINYRYPDTLGNFEVLPGPIGVDWAAYTYNNPRYRLTAVEALKALDGYEYQACEHPSWRTSEAFRFCQSLRSAVIGCIPGYDTAPWTWSTAEVAARRNGVLR